MPWGEFWKTDFAVFNGLCEGHAWYNRSSDEDEGEGTSEGALRYLENLPEEV